MDNTGDATLFSIFRRCERPTQALVLHGLESTEHQALLNNLEHKIRTDIVVVVLNRPNLSKASEVILGQMLSSITELYSNTNLQIGERVAATVPRSRWTEWPNRL